MADTPRGEHLRYRILHVLHQRDREPGGALLELGEIAEALDVPNEDVRDQLEILESTGAIDADLTFTDAAPTLLGNGKLLLEQLEGKCALSDQQPESASPVGANPVQKPADGQRTATSEYGATSKTIGEPLELFEQVVSDLLGGYDLVTCYRRCLLAVRALQWTEDEDWIHRELHGYPSDDVPPPPKGS